MVPPPGPHPPPRGRGRGVRLPRSHDASPHSRVRAGRAGGCHRHGARRRHPLAAGGRDAANVRPARWAEADHVARADRGPGHSPVPAGHPARASGADADPGAAPADPRSPRGGPPRPPVPARPRQPLRLPAGRSSGGAGRGGAGAAARAGWLAHRRAGRGPRGHHGAVGAHRHRPGAGERRPDGAVLRRCASAPRADRGPRGAALDSSRLGAPVPPAARVERSAGVSHARVATVLVAAWAAAFWLSEGLLQAVADLSLLASAALLLRGAALPPEARLPARAALALAGWQALSPLITRALGVPGLPPAGLWLHCLDTAALAAAALLGAQVVRWTWPAALFLAGGVLSFALSIVQHLVRWSIPVPRFLRLPVDRVHETFGGEDRYAAGGFFFHRLRLAHASVAALGPAVATALRPGATRIRVLAAVLTVASVGCIVLAYARAALLTALLLVLVAGVAVARSARVRMGALVVLLAVAALATASPGWRARFAAAAENFQGGERALARAAGWDLVYQRPWLGVGFGNYRQAALERQSVT